MNREQGCFYCFDSFIYTVVIVEVIVKLFCDGVHFYALIFMFHVNTQGLCLINLFILLYDVMLSHR